ncbi:MAG: V-type ATP synthase subunit F [Candidatus Aegiribacteria sp.]|nr:V-type ATP synthase subunit F [Candidatus Aegiribacteria sp.]
MAEGKIAFIGDADSVLGFRALGVETVVPMNMDSAREQFARLVKEKTSIIMITENMMDHLQEQIDETVHMAIPSVVVLPGITGTQKRGEDTIRELIIRAVGVDLMSEEQK